jgi:pyruvate/2-oxoglutarate dehydrogenase complex dihydrolipoamide dehydrogenase (E3) component
MLRKTALSGRLPMVNLDILVIGGGTAGTDAARTANGNGRKVGIIEKGPIGGDCIFHACIPTKAMVSAARAYKK